MAVSTNTLRSGLLLAVVVVASAVALGSLAGGAITEEANAEDTNAEDANAEGAFAVQQDPAVFEERTVVEQRGDVARFTILFDDTDRVTLTVGSSDVNYEVSFTVVDRDDDGEATVQMNTAVAGLDDNASGFMALGRDEIEDYNRTTGPIPGPLDATLYDLGLTVDGQLTDVGVLVLEERSTDKMTVWTAPDAAQPESAVGLADVATQRDQIAQEDWAVLAIDVSGIFGYVEDASDLDDPANGLNVSVIEDPGRNRPEQPANLSRLSVVPDASNDVLYVLFDTDNLTVGSEYTATFTIDDRNPYLEPGENESVSAPFSFVDRSISFEGLLAGGQLELPAASEATVNGTASVAPGTEIGVEVRSEGDNASLGTSEATVTDDGNWSVTFDFSNVSVGTSVRVLTDDPSANVTGTIVEPETTETTETTGTTETTEMAETTGVTETTETVEETETTTVPEDETQTPGGEPETTEVGITEEVVETTTSSSSSAKLTAGLPGRSIGFVALLIGAMLGVLRRS